jgi:hypothetical protein
VSRAPSNTPEFRDWALRSSTIYLRFAQAHAEGEAWLFAVLLVALLALFLVTHAWWCAALIALCEFCLLRKLSCAARCREELLAALGEEGAR